MDDKGRIYFARLLFSLLLILLAENTFSIASNEWYISKAVGGQEPISCDSPKLPCKSLLDVLPYAAWGDTIHLDGANTEVNPYTCNPVTSQYPGPRLNINISLSLIGHNALVFLRCPNGISFTNSGAHVVFSGLKFISTPLSFNYCSVSIQNSFFGSYPEFHVGRSAGENNADLSFYSMSNLSIVDSVFDRNAKVLVQGGGSTYLIGSRFQGNTGLAVSVSPSPRGTVTVNNCAFINNWGGLRVNKLNKSSLHLENTLFSQNKDGSALDLELIVSSSAVLRNITVQNNLLANQKKTYRRTASVYISGGLQGHNDVYIGSSSFKQNSNTKYGVGGIFIDHAADLMTSQGCKDVFNTSIDAYPVFSYTNRILFENTVFEQNIGQFTGAVFASNGLTVFKNCTFLNNFAEFRSGHVSVAGGTGGLEFYNCTFRQTQEAVKPINGRNFSVLSFLYSSSPGTLVLKDTFMEYLPLGEPEIELVQVVDGGNVQIEDSFSLVCPVGSKLFIDNYSHAIVTRSAASMDNHCGQDIKVYSMYCYSCEIGYYSLQRGYANGTTVRKGFQCLPCPFGGNCSRNIVNQANFWGSLEKLHPPTLNFYVCPLGYCTSPENSAPSVYNGCRGNRAGVLCGSCAEGYSETLFSTECRRNEDCSDFWFWPAAILYAVGVALFFVTKPPFIPYLVSHIFRFRATSAKDGEESEIQSGNKDSEETTKSDVSVTSCDPGYLKVIFYFYQVVKLLLVTTTTAQIIQVHFLNPLLNMFNFQIRASTTGVGCPFPGITIPIKELFTLFDIFSVVLCIFLLYGAHQLCAKIRHSSHPSLARYLAAATEVILLGYASLATSAFKLLTMLRVGPSNELRMYFDGNIVFFQWWQYVMLGCVVVYVVPFVGLLFWGASWLNESRITAREFLIASVVPLPFLLYWLIWRGKRASNKQTRLQEIEERVAVMEVLHGPFRVPKNGEKGALYWESVLIGRRLILIVTFAFIQMASLRLLLSTVICILNLVHHVFCSPYKDRTVNIMETVSLLTLNILAMFNTVHATLITAGARLWGPIKTYIDVLEWIQACVLALLPLALIAAVILAVLSQVVRAGFVSCALLRQLVIGVRRRKSPSVISESKSNRDATRDSLFCDAEQIDNPPDPELACEINLAPFSHCNGGQDDSDHAEADDKDEKN